jgi:hypothetical protein
VFTTMGHTRARYFGPEIGVIIFNSLLNNSVFPIDHDQAFQQTNHRSLSAASERPLINFSWRYDSGLVVGSVPDIDTALSLTGAEQSAIGFFCGSQRPTLNTPITACDSGGGATRLRIPAEGTQNDDTNPARVAPRQVFDLGAGTGNLLRREPNRVTLQLTVVNLTNKVALYNFLSTFGGTHFLSPRTYEASVGFVFLIRISALFRYNLGRWYVRPGDTGRRSLFWFSSSGFLSRRRKRSAHRIPSITRRTVVVSAIPVTCRFCKRRVTSVFYHSLY